MANEDEKPIIIKKIKKGGGGHHGGAWKVAYADFVTAMMAFFLMLWLLNVATDDQKAQLAAYFEDPTHPKVSRQTSGAGGVLGGVSVSPIGNMSSSLQPPVAPPVQKQPKGQVVKPQEQKGSGNETNKKENDSFNTAKKLIEQAIKENPALEALKEHLQVEITNEGLRIQIVDKEGESMFPLGSAKMFDKTRDILYAVAEIIKDMPNDISIRGHTDGKAYQPGATYTNWELSADRANASRRALLAAGIKKEKLADVMGKADTDLFDKKDPAAPQNRRISIVLLRDKVKKEREEQRKVQEPDTTPSIPMDVPPNAEPQEESPGYKKTEGKIYFP